MKKIYLFLFLLVLLTPVFSADRDEKDWTDEYSPLFLYGLGLTEAQISNIALWGFNRYVTQADYGMISFDSMRTNLTNPWVWDQDEFAVNHMGHPYQGALYYGAARSSGNGFWSSLSITALGSVSWELLMETETPSINDLIVTTMGGVSFGEMLFRLSDVVLYGEEGTIDNPGVFRWIGATALSPMTSLNHGLLPGRPPEARDVSGFSSLTLGYSFADVSFLPRPDSILKANGFSLTYNLLLDYGSPFIKKGQGAPFDWFSLRTGAGLNFNNELFLTLFTAGHLGGWTLYGKKDHVRNQLGFYLHYDFIYNRIINLGANSIGPGWIRTSQRGKWTLDTRVYLNLVAMGASDLIYLKYNDIVNEPPDYERRNYSLSSGVNLKAGLYANRDRKTWLDLVYNGYNLYIIDASVPDSGAGGKEIIGSLDLALRQKMGKNLYLGLQGTIYHKESFYHEPLLDIDELLWKTGISTGFRF
ncbi:MAG: DUF3943 domain-containing protein [Spirochaetales bacterium]|nr:DUF3943 domain-containing protein [Spirochaetales bacterium]